MNKFDFLLSKIFIRLVGHHTSDFSDVFWHKMRIPPLQKIVPKSVMFGIPAKKSKNGFILCSDWIFGYFWWWNYLELEDFNIFKANWLIPTSFSLKMKIKFACISVKCRNSPIYEFISLSEQIYKLTCYLSKFLTITDMQFFKWYYYSKSQNYWLPILFLL